MLLPPGAAEIALALLGLCVGSFLNVCIHRLPLKQSVVHPRSRCPKCGYMLRWYDNMPVLSYAMLRARCRSCGAPISLQYPLIEVITAIVFVAHWYVFGATVMLPLRLLFACALIVLFMIDLEHQILPDVITLPGIVLGVALSLVLPPGLVESLLGVVVGGGLLWGIAELWYRLRKVEAMGFGDVKMLAMIGAFLGWKLMLLTLVLSSFLGSIVGVAMIAFKRGDMKYALPFGTFLALGALVAASVGDRIIEWYSAFYY
jgi:leader peptidase (prepilin peptidase) / N-methyltransferase